MRRLSPAWACLLLALAAPASARAQDLFAFSTPGKLISETELAASASGEIGVSFHADPATGCAALAACGYAGSLAWSPEGGGTLDVVKFRQGGRVHVLALLSFGENSPNGSPLMAASVHRLAGGQPAGTCSDEEPGTSAIQATSHGGRITFTLSDALAATRCAGPLPGDLAAIAPRATLRTRTLGRGSFRLDFRARRSFAGHGFAGTLTSTVVITLRRAPPQAPGPPLPPPPPPPPSPPTRIVTESLRVSALTGSLTATVAGSRGEVCGLLDSCGLTGTLTITPKLLAPQGSIAAIGPASRPYRDFLAALGLSRSGHPRGIQVSGEVSWGDSGTAAATLRQGASCSDRAPIGVGLIGLEAVGGKLSLTYSLSGGAVFGGSAPLRTRCPGPMLAQASQLASATIPRSRLRQRAFTVRLRGGGSFADEGYDASLGGELSLRLRRGRVTQRIVPGD